MSEHSKSACLGKAARFSASSVTHNDLGGSSTSGAIWRPWRTIGVEAPAPHFC